MFFSTLDKQKKVKYVVEGYGIGTIDPRTFKELTDSALIHRCEERDSKKAREICNQLKEFYMRLSRGESFRELEKEFPDLLKRAKISAWICDVDVIKLTSEHEKPDINPDNVTIVIADFADSLTVSYKNITLYFDMSKIEDPYGLVKAFKDAFKYILKEE